MPLRGVRIGAQAQRTAYLKGWWRDSEPIFVPLVVFSVCLSGANVTQWQKPLRGVRIGAQAQRTRDIPNGISEGFRTHICAISRFICLLIRHKCNASAKAAAWGSNRCTSAKNKGYPERLVEGFRTHICAISRFLCLLVRRKCNASAKAAAWGSNRCTSAKNKGYPIWDIPCSWSWWRDSNPRPADYESAALPLSHTSDLVIISY